MKQFKFRKFRTARRFFLLFTALVTAAALSAAESEKPETAAEEEGLQELQPLLELSAVEDTDGLDLEQLTQTIDNEAMSEYFNSETGFSMRYPSSFVFSEDSGTAAAASSDGKIHMIIEAIPRDEALTMEVIQQVIMMDSPDAGITKYPESDTIRFERKQDDGSLLVDVYMFTESMLHHVSITCADGSEEVLHTYLDYMINSMTTNETEVG